MQREGLVSTLIPVFNRSHLLREAVGSVLAQTYRPIEIIISDDGSTDDTPRVIAELQAQHPEIIHSIRIPNSGPGAAREAARLIAEGEFIQYLDSDDIIDRRKFERQVEGLRANSACGVAYGWTRFYKIGELPPPRPWKRTGEAIPTMFPSFLQSRWWDTSTPLYRRYLTDRAGPWRTLRCEEDWEYDCRIASLGVKLHHVPAFVSDTRTHQGEMLSADGATAPKLRERTLAHVHILQHAQRANITPDTPEMRHFARELFLLCRQCGAAGMPAEAQILFDLAREASGPERARSLQFRLYGAIALTLGWTFAGRAASSMDTLRR